MRVVLATLNFPPARGGVEQLCLELVRELVALGVGVHVLAPAQDGDRAFDAAAPCEVQRYAVGSLRHWWLAHALHRELSAHPESVVLFGQWTAAGAALLSPAVRRARCFTLGHAKEFLRTTHGWRSSAGFDAYRRAVLTRIDAVLAVSGYTAERARECGAQHVHVIPLGVDASRFAGPTAEASRDANEFVLLTVARLVARKGIDTMIAALPAIVQVHPNVRYRVVGDGPDRERLLALAAQHGVSAQVELAGAADREALPAIYAAADVFVLASREDPITGDVEGFGLVLLEAQAAGTAVIAARSGGMPDAVVEGETGLIVPPDDPRALSDAVLALLADPQRRARMAEAARAHARTRTWRACATVVTEIVAAQPQAGSPTRVEV